MSTLRNAKRVPMTRSGNGSTVVSSSPERIEEEDKRSAPQGPRRILGFQERADMEDMLMTYRSQLSGSVEGIPERLKQHIDPARRFPSKVLEAKVRQLEKILSETEPDSLSKWGKEKIDKRYNELTEILRKKMVPEAFVHLKAGKDGIRYTKAVTSMSRDENSREFQRLAMEWKQIQRQREPDNPDAENLENIRPETVSA